MAAVGINFTLQGKDFTFDSTGKTEFVLGRDRNIRNFEKMLRTEAGDLNVFESNDVRYNPQYGLALEKMLGQKNIDNVNRVQTEVQRAVDRFISNQKVLLDYLDEDEVFVKGVVLAVPYFSIGVYFTVGLYTAKNIRLNESPNFEKTFVQRV